MRSRGTLEFRVFSESWNYKQRFFIINRLPDDSMEIAKLEWVKVDEGDLAPDDTGIIISNVDGHALADELARAGYAAQETKGELKAMRGHLEDMRSLVFKRAPK